MDLINIGNVKIEKTAALAPMASVADFAFRTMAKSFGAAYMVGEMASAKGLCYNDTKTAQLLTVTEAERPMAIQLFGSEPDTMAKAVEIAAGFSPDIIDINAGCPVPKVAGNGSGCALMKDLALLGRIVRAAAQATDIPVTIKLRSGWDHESINAVEAALVAEENGAKAVTIHGRTREQMYSGKAQLDVIRSVKAAVKIPVIGNGDVRSAEDCATMYRETGCDLVMVGRGAYGRPWIFKEIKAYLETGEILPEADAAYRFSVLKEHIELLVRDKGEYIGMKEARKHAGWYLKGLPGAARWRGRCGELSTLADLYRMLEEFAEGLSE